MHHIDTLPSSALHLPRGWVVLGLALVSWAAVFGIWTAFANVSAALIG
jgi:hypothetical protein